MSEKGTLAEAFLAAVDEVEHVLVDEFGLTRGRTHENGPNEASVAFKSEGARLTLDCNKGELDALFEPRGQRPGSRLKLGTAFHLRLVLALKAIPGGRTRWPRIIGRDTADQSLRLLLDDVVEHARPWILDEPEAFERLSHFRDIETSLKMAQFGPGRRPREDWAQVKEAWESQDLPALTVALEALSPPLRDAEEDALAYARRWTAEAEDVTD